MRTYQSESEARDAMVATNRRGGYVVMVEGPEDGEFSVMSAGEAIENDFAYEWAVR